MCKGSNTSTVVQNPTVPDWLSSKFQNLANSAETTAGAAYNPATSKSVAGFSDDQLAGMQGVRDNAGIWAPFTQASADLASQASGPLTGQNIQNYMNPFQNQVLDATMSRINQNNQQQMKNVTGNAAMQSALGNDRLGLQKSALAGEQDLASGQIMANLNAQNYNQALAATQADRAAQFQGATTFANLGNQAANLAGQDSAKLLESGGLQQSLGQNILDTASSNAAAQANYPFSTQNWLSGMLTGSAAPFTGYTQSTTGPSPSIANTIGGLGLGLAGLKWSDPELKADGGRVGELDDGTPIHIARYLDSDEPELMVMSDEVSPRHKVNLGGYDAVDYIGVAADAKKARGREGYEEGGYTLPGQYQFRLGGNKNQSQGPATGRGGPYGSASLGLGALSQQAGQNIRRLPSMKLKTPPTMDPARQMLRDGQDAANLARIAQKGSREMGGWLGFGDGANTRSYSGTDTPDTNDDSPTSLGGSMDDLYARGGRIGYQDGGETQIDETDPFANPQMQSPVETPQQNLDATPQVNLSATANQPFATETPQQAPPTPGLGNPNVASFMDAQGAPGKGDVGPSPGPRNAPNQNGPGNSWFFGGRGLDNPNPMGLALMQAGFGMMASKSPFPGVALGEGGMQGVKGYMAAHQNEQRLAELKRQADQWKAEHDLRKAASDRAEAEAAQRAKLMPLQLNRAQIENQTLQQTFDQTQQQLQMFSNENLANLPGFTSLSEEQQGLLRSMTPQQRAQAFSQRFNAESKPNFTQIGEVEDQYGVKKKIYGFVNPATNQVTPIPLPDQHVAPTSPVAGPRLTGDPYLATIDPQIAEQVRAISEGRQPFPTGQMMRTPYGKRLIDALSQYDPNFDAVNYQSRNATRKDFTSGNAAKNITSFNTAIGHLGTLAQAAEDLNNGPVPLWNSAENMFARNVSPDFAKREQKFKVAKNAAVEELTKAFKGTAGSLTEVQQWEKAINEADSPEALQGAIQQAVELLNSRIEAVGQQYNRGMGTTRDPLDLLDPHAKDTLLSLKAGDKANTPPVQVGSVEEAEKLPKGTVFITPNGKRKVKD